MRENGLDSGGCPAVRAAGFDPGAAEVGVDSKGDKEVSMESPAVVAGFVGACPCGTGSAFIGLALFLAVLVLADRVGTALHQFADGSDTALGLQRIALALDQDLARPIDLPSLLIDRVVQTPRKGVVAVQQRHRH
jgi:hypothetical protein